MIYVRMNKLQINSTCLGASHETSKADPLVPQQLKNTEALRIE